MMRIEWRSDADWHAWLDREVVGTAHVRPEETPGVRFLRLEVDEAHRGKGIGRALFDTVANAVRQEGARALAAIVRVDTPGEKFAIRRGATVADELVHLALDFSELDPGTPSVSMPAGYRLVQWRGAAPEEFVDSFAAAKRVIADAPNRKPPAIPKWDRNLVRAEEARHGDNLWVSAAIIEPDTVVAFSQAITDTTTEVSQEDTVVLADHRRRGLASAVKADLLRQLARERPDLTRISVTTAVANIGMRTVNERLGFREQYRRNLVLVELA